MSLRTWVDKKIYSPAIAESRDAQRRVKEAGRFDRVAARLSDNELFARIRSERSGSDISPMLLAFLREASVRALGQRPFDVQLFGAYMVANGNIIEMETGEGKTLVGAIAAILSGRRVHLITANDYLAERDCEWMSPLLSRCGLTTRAVTSEADPKARRDAYLSDVVYAPITEIGFDLLRDRQANDLNVRLGPTFDLVIVDEADAIMLDEAMVPLVLAGEVQGEDRDQRLRITSDLVSSLEVGVDYSVDAESLNASFTEQGIASIEHKLGIENLYSEDNVLRFNELSLSLHAHALMKSDVDYVVNNGSLHIVNQARGRLANNQRWPDGLQEAIEAKEHLSISPAGEILDQITIQDLLGNYNVRSGMSGTVEVVAEDLFEFYKTRTCRIPRNEDSRRVDMPDIIVSDAKEKFEAIARIISAATETGRPVLVCTQSVLESRKMSEKLDELGIENKVLNAKNDADEARVISAAGRIHAVTVSTQMSGRGTDIRLGGTEEGEAREVRRLGGLLVVLCGRFPSARLDSQARGRTARQADPGETVAVVSLTDALIREHAPSHHLEKLVRTGIRLKEKELRKIVSTAQRIADGQRLDLHRTTWAYNRAITAQRRFVLMRREEILLSALSQRQDLETSLRLFWIDRTWADHLQLLNEIRDGIHLRALGGQAPLDEFHLISFREFEGFMNRVEDRVQASLVKAKETDTFSLDEIGLRRPTATWTYMVRDNPFGTPGDRVARNLAKRLRPVPENSI